MRTLVLDGKPVPAPEGATLLTVARAAGADVPTLCNYEGMLPYGACRLCVMEVSRPGENGNGRIVASCNHPAEEGLRVRTASENVRLVRRTVMELLLARCPAAPEVREVAGRLGVTETPYPPDVARDRCILCGLCVRVCANAGAFAISAAGRGVSREIAPPFGEPPGDCVGCLACARVCPTGNIPFEEDEAARRIWGRSFELHPCPGCGKRFIPKEQAVLLAKRLEQPVERLLVCDACKAKESARKFMEITRLGLGGTAP